MSSLVSDEIGVSTLKLRAGLDVDLAGQPKQEISAGAAISEVGVMGSDFPDIRPKLCVAVGDKVRTGDTLFVDRKRNQIAFTAPATGTIASISRGRRRTLETLTISVEEENPKEFPISDGKLTPESVRSLLQASGLWVAFLTRPFGRIPDPAAVPHAIFVTAINTDPLSADAAVVMAPQHNNFVQGLEALKTLTKGPVFVCQQSGAQFAQTDEQIKTAFFDGPHPAGLASTHIHHLMPASERRTVWHIDFSDVIAIGHLFGKGQLLTERIVSIAGSGVRHPRLIRTRLGAQLNQLLDRETTVGSRVISGSALSGRVATHLGRYDTQVTVFDSTRSAKKPTFWSRALSLLPNGSVGPTIPSEALDAALPFDILATPLMRALSVGDIETAIHLGCLELIEEDVALLSYLCPSRADYGMLLRHILDEIAGEQE